MERSFKTETVWAFCKFLTCSFWILCAKKQGHLSILIPTAVQGYLWIFADIPLFLKDKFESCRGWGGRGGGTLKKCERDVLEICQDHLFPSLSYFPLLYSIIGQSSRTPQNRIHYPLKPKHMLLRLSKDLWQIIFTKAAFWHFRESFFETVFFFSLWL